MREPRSAAAVLGRVVKARPASQAGSSTAVVLWLMILLVFVPIAAGHGFARFASRDVPTDVGVGQR